MISASPNGYTPLRVLVTGAGGFVGSRLLSYLAGHTPWELVSASRGEALGVRTSTSFAYGDLAEDPPWQKGLTGIDTVIHLAARVHLMQDDAAHASELYRRINVDATESLARAAAAAGARRFVFVSSVKVNGDSTNSAPFRPDDPPRPRDLYGLSKLQAELVLRDVAAASAMELVIVRPCLVYGPGVGANFRSLMRWLRRGVPLPFGAIRNSRSLLAIDNLCSLLTACVAHPSAAGQVFLPSDGEDVSTTELLRRLGSAMGHRARLVSVPEHAVRAALSFVGRRDIGARLCDSLCVDSLSTRHRLDWQPPVTLDEGLRLTASAFLAAAAEKSQ